jgi:hypothetical protein
MRLALLSVVVAAAAACHKPCDELAERTCAVSGEPSSACSGLRDKASKAGQSDQEACGVALELVEILDRR